MNRTESPLPHQSASPHQGASPHQNRGTDQGPVSEVTVKAKPGGAPLSTAGREVTSPHDVSEVRGAAESVSRFESPLQEGELTEQEMTRYLSEVFGGATGISIRVKDSARAQLRPLERLPELHRLLLEKHIWGAQIRYCLQDSEWTDTLISTHSGARVVRVRH